MPCVDLTYLERLYKGDRVRIAAWVELFLEEVPQRMEELAQCVERCDAIALAALAHELKPQAHYLGAARMHEVLVRIGEGTRCNGPADCATEVLELREACADVERELRGRFSP